MHPIILSILIILTATVVAAAPFVTADPSEATKYRMRLSTDGVTWSAWQEGSPVAGAMKFDLSTVPAGEYECEFQSSMTVTGRDPLTGQTTYATLWVVPVAPFVLTIPTGRTVTNIRVTTE